MRWVFSAATISMLCSSSVWANEDAESRLISLTEVEYPRFEISFGGKHKERESEIIEVAEFIGVKSFKAKGKRLTSFMVDNIKEIEPIIKKEAETVKDESPEIDPPQTLSHEDPSQMKLEL